MQRMIGDGWTARLGSVDVTKRPHRKRLMLAPGRIVDVPTKEQAKKYAALFDYFNKTLFNDLLRTPLPHPILNFSRKRGAGAFFAARSWKDPMTGELMDEISIVPDSTSQDPIRLCSDLVHEMAHFRVYLDGNQCKNGYHGKHWFTLMEKLGLPGQKLKGSFLRVSHDILPGGAFEKAFNAMPGDLMLSFITSRPANDWDGYVTTNSTQGKRAKYQCVMCAMERNGGGIMRGPTGMQLRCVIHDEDLLEMGW